MLRANAWLAAAYVLSGKLGLLLAPSAASARWRRSRLAMSAILKSRRGTRSIEMAQLFRRIADAIPHLLWTARPDGAVEYLNARTVQYTGMTAEALRHDWKPVIHAAA